MLTLGHGTAAADELVRLITNAGVEAIVDVRKMPESRRYPQFGREEMERWIPACGASAYRWEPALGGFRKSDRNSANVALRNSSFRAYADYMETDLFARALDDVLVQAKSSRVAILCSETLWWRCHRRLISDAALLVHGVTVEHLMHDGKCRPHVPTAGVRKTEANTLRYDVFEDDAMMPPRSKDRPASKGR